MLFLKENEVLFLHDKREIEEFVKNRGKNPHCLNRQDMHVYNQNRVNATIIKITAPYFKLVLQLGFLLYQLAL